MGIKVLELFAGIGACSKALQRLGIKHEIVDAVEIDKYAIASFNAIHGTNFEVQDITTWNKDIECDLIMHGSPCQDFSVAGKQAGGDVGSGTRSSLMYETIRIVGKLRPKYVVWENVKNLLSKKHKHNFDAYIETMNILGYNSYYQVLNAKDYGIPQNRERVFTISIRKDIGKDFKFPEKQELKLRLKDMLEDEVDEKYYLSDTQINKITTSNFMQEKKRIQEKEYSDTILARDWKDPKCVRIGGMYGQTTRWGLYDDNGIAPTMVAAMGEGGGYVPMVKRIGGIFDTETSKHQAGSIYDKDGISPTLDVMQGGWRQPSIIEDKLSIKNATKKGYDEAVDGDSINLSYPNSNTRRGRVGHQVSQTIQCNDMIGGVVKNNGLRIRKLTPKECWRLMGFDDEDFEKAKAVPMSNTQLYKQAGNSIVVNVLERIFEKLFYERIEEV